MATWRGSLREVDLVEELALEAPRRRQGRPRRSCRRTSLLSGSDDPRTSVRPLAPAALGESSRRSPVSSSSRDAVRRDAAARRVREHAADRAHHAAQESVAAKERLELGAALVDRDGVERADGRLARRRGARRRCRSRACRAARAAASRMRSTSARGRDRRDERRFARCDDLGAAPAVEVLLPGRVEPRVKVGLGARRPRADGRPAGRRSLTASRTTPGGRGRGRSKCDDLAVGVNARRRSGWRPRRARSRAPRLERACVEDRLHRARPRSSAPASRGSRCRRTKPSRGTARARSCSPAAHRPRSLRRGAAVARSPRSNRLGPS